MRRSTARQSILNPAVARSEDVVAAPQCKTCQRATPTTDGALGNPEFGQTLKDRAARCILPVFACGVNDNLHTATTQAL